MKESKRNLNHDIKADKVQVITDWWENLWIMKFSDALERAEDDWLDLMEIWKNGDVVIVKMLDYGKYLYKMKKQDQKNKQKTKTPELKTIRISFSIWEHDLWVRKKQAEWFAKNWNPLKVTLFLRWRERQYEDLAQKKLESFVESLQDIYKMDSKIGKMWNLFYVLLKPNK